MITGLRHFAPATECSRVFHAINYLDLDCQTLLSIANPTVMPSLMVPTSLRLYSLKRQEQNRGQSKTTKDSTDFISIGLNLRQKGINSIKDSHLPLRAGVPSLSYCHWLIHFFSPPMRRLYSLLCRVNFQLHILCTRII